MSELAKEYKQEAGVDIQLSGGGATRGTRGIRGVASGEIQIGGSCRHALDVPEENKAFLYPIAWDALVIVTQKDNPIENITSSQLKGIYSGDILDWSELGLPKNYGKINLHIRVGKISGVGFMSRLLMFYNPDMEFKSNLVHKSSGPLEKALSEDLRGIAITGVSSARKRPNLKILGLDGVKPSAEQIIKGNYSLIRPLYITVHKDKSETGPAADFVKYALSSKGQSVISNTGTVPMAKVGDKLFEQFYKKMDQAKQKTAQLREQAQKARALLKLPLDQLLEIQIN